MSKTKVVTLNDVKNENKQTENKLQMLMSGYAKAITELNENAKVMAELRASKEADEEKLEFMEGHIKKLALTIESMAKEIEYLKGKKEDIPDTMIQEMKKIIHVDDKQRKKYYEDALKKKKEKNERWKKEFRERYNLPQ